MLVSTSEMTIIADPRIVREWFFADDNASRYDMSPIAVSMDMLADIFHAMRQIVKSSLKPHYAVFIATEMIMYRRTRIVRNSL